MNPSSSTSPSSSPSDDNDNDHNIINNKRKKNPNYVDDAMEMEHKLKHDVFVNFSSEDIGNSFISHLVGALRRHSFTIFDHTMIPKGHHVCSELLKAIQESHIYLVVFSINYAVSARSLDELVDIMDCLRNGKQSDQRKVLPVFFKVDPSHVRSQRGSFEEAFKAHETNLDPARVEKWKQTLKSAGELSGYHLQNGQVDIQKPQEVINRPTCHAFYDYTHDTLSFSLEFGWDEEKFISQIVEELENMQNPQELHVTDYPVGIAPRVQELISNLRLDVENVSIVAVLGISGIGKSTIVRATYNRIASKFDACCFLADIHYHCQSPYWKVHLQKELISCLARNDKLPVTHSHYDGVTKIRKLITRQKVLLVLDDVDNFEQLQALGIRQASFYNGSRIIVTTRDKRTLGLLPHASYNIRLLNRRESLDLFIQLTFEKDDPIDKKFVQEIVRYAAGLPLVLEVWSRHFKHHAREQWPSVLETLKRIPHGDVQKKLQISYDSLTKRDQKLFLDIACFFYGMYKDLAVKILQDEVSAFFPDNHIRYLVDKGLVKIGFGTELLMFHAIREMGQEIVRQQSEDEPGERTRLRDRTDVLHVLSECSGTKSVESIRLDFEKKEDDVIIVQVEAFRDMSNLRLIQLLDPYLSWTCGDDDMPSFSFKKLKYLEWYGFPFKSINNIDMANVEIVRLENSKLEILWDGIKGLKKLRILDVNSSSSLTKTGNFSRLENLEELYFQFCSNLEELHNSVGCLDKLAILDLYHCTRLERFPWEIIVKLRSLQDIRLNQCHNIGLERDEVMDHFFTSLKECRITQLQLAGCKISKISGEVGNLTWLKHLNLSENEFPSLPCSLVQLRDLKTLELSFCANLLSIPDLPPNLTSVRARKCASLVSLPSNMSELKSLTELWLTGCSKLGSEDPECLMKVTGLRSLRDLTMKDCNLSQIPIEIGNLKSLQRLELSGNTFSSIPDSFSNLSRLHALKINDCPRLQSLPLLPANLSGIEASGCWALDVMSSDSKIPTCISCCPTPTFMCRCIHSSDQFNTQIREVCKKLPFSSRLCISLSGNVVPNWCSYRYRAPILSFVAPLHLDKKISGIILCAATQLNRVRDWYLRTKILNKTKGTSYRLLQVIDPYCTMFVKFFPLDDDTLVVEAGDLVVLKFLGKYARNGILGWSLCLTYEGDVIDRNLVIEPTSSIPSEMTITDITQLDDDIWSESESDDEDICTFPIGDDDECL